MTTETSTLERLFVGRADWDTSFALIQRYSGDSDFRHLGFRAGQWFETIAPVYDHFLGAVPPLYQTGGGFVVGECTTGTLYEGFLEIDGRFCCIVVDWSGPRSLAALWTDLIAELERSDRKTIAV